MPLDLEPLAGSPAIALALERITKALEGDGAGTYQAVTALGSVLTDVSEQEATPLTQAIVTLASMAARAKQLAAARSLLLHALMLALGDPHDVMLDLGAAHAFRSEALHGAHAGAYRGLVSESQALAQLADEPSVAVDADDSVACRLPRQSELASTARLICSFLPREAFGQRLCSRLEADDRAWSRACGLLWMDEANADGVARDAAEPPLVRAAAALRAGVDDIARGEAPRPDVLAILGELVAPVHDAWEAQWAPIALFSEHADRKAMALLSPSARIRFGSTRPTRAQQLEQVLLATLDVLPDQHHQRAALAGNLLYFALATRAPSWPNDRDEIIVPTLEELAPGEREVLDLIARKVSLLEWDYDVHHALFDLGLPATYTGLRRYLGIDPPGPMDTLVTVQIAGEQATLPLALAAQRMLVGIVDATELARAMAEALAPRELVYVGCEAFNGFDARLHCTGPEQGEDKLRRIFDELRLAAIEACDPAVILPALIERADRLLDDMSTSSPPSTLLRAMARVLAKRGEVLPERFDGLVSELLQAFPPDPQTAREILTGALTQARRDRIILRVQRRPAFGTPHDYSDLLSEEMRHLPPAPPRPFDDTLTKLGLSLLEMLNSLKTEQPE